jgi:hypothetical protein
MAELERDLRVLAAYVDLPAERDLWPGIEARLGARRPGPWLRIAAVVAVVVALAIGIAFAVPPARGAILRFFGLEGVSIVRVEKLPRVPARLPRVFGNRTTLDGAERRLGFRPFVPDLGPPAKIYTDYSNQAVLLLYGRPRPLRLEETRIGIFQKLVSGRERVERVSVDGNPGVWFPDVHVVGEFFDQPRMSGSALIWERDGITLRLEGRLTKAEALRIARSTSP